MSESIFALPGWKKNTFSGVTYHYLHIRASSKDRPTFLCFHGWPNGVLTFRKIIPKLVAQGCGVILPEMLGYGQTDKPTDLAAYSKVAISDSFAEIVAAENVSNAVLLGHDWGSTVAARFVLKYPELTEAVILTGFPYWPPRGDVFPAVQLNEHYKPILGYEPFAYMEWFITDEAPKLITEHLESFVYTLLTERIDLHFCPRGVLQASLREDIKLPSAPWVKDSDRQELLEFLKQNDMKSFFNWYRSALQYADERDHALPKRLKLPYLYFECEKDSTIPPGATDEQDEYCDKLTIKRFPGGHFLLEEEPEGVWKAIQSWLPTVTRY